MQSWWEQGIKETKKKKKGNSQKAKKNTAYVPVRHRAPTDPQVQQPPDLEFQYTSAIVAFMIPLLKQLIQSNHVYPS